MVQGINSFTTTRLNALHMENEKTHSKKSTTKHSSTNTQSTINKKKKKKKKGNIFSRALNSLIGKKGQHAPTQTPVPDKKKIKKSKNKKTPPPTSQPPTDKENKRNLFMRCLCSIPTLFMNIARAVGRFLRGVFLLGYCRDASCSCAKAKKG